MKQFIRIILMTLVAQLHLLNIQAQAPQTFPYQAVARNANGNLIANQLISLRMSIIDSIVIGVILYKETQLVTTNSLGLFTINIGQGIVISGSMNAINWDHNSKFLKVEMDALGGSNFIIMGSSQLMSVPYAISAKTTSSLPNGTAVGNTPYWNGTTWANDDNTIYNDGYYVGIGTNVPQYKLDVVHGGASGIRSKSNSLYSVIDIDAANGDAALRYKSAGITKWNMRNNATTNNLQILRTNNIESFTIEASSGFVGINKPDPAEQLDVTGNAHITGNETLGGKLIVENNKGIVRSDNGTQLKTVLFSGGIAYTLPPGGMISFTMNYSAFSSVPTISVGNISGTLTHPEFILYTIRNADNDSAVVDIYNAGSSTATMTGGTFRAIVIGAE